jgi:hypothetical protein
MQNVRIWTDENPHILQQAPLYNVMAAPIHSLQNFEMCYKTCLHAVRHAILDVYKIWYINVNFSQ